MAKKTSIDLLLGAISFASIAHRHQLRKDNVTPYISHPCRVAMVLRHVLGIEDERIVAAAVLHDTIEDTTTDFDDIGKHFGAEIASWVAVLSKDMRLPEEQRESNYLKSLAEAPDPVKLVKIADLYDNVLDSRVTMPTTNQKHVEKAKVFLKVLSKSRMSSKVIQSGKRTFKITTLSH